MVVALASHLTYVSSFKQRKSLLNFHIITEKKVFRILKCRIEYQEAWIVVVILDYYMYMNLFEKEIFGNFKKYRK